jgi:hypothetical protein
MARDVVRALLGLFDRLGPISSLLRVLSGVTSRRDDCQTPAHHLQRPAHETLLHDRIGLSTVAAAHRPGLAINPHYGARALQPTLPAAAAACRVLYSPERYTPSEVHFQTTLEKFVGTSARTTTPL